MKNWFRAYCERLLLVVFAILYLFERSREPALGDSLSFSVAALQGFDLSTNATNHFLYLNVLHLVSNLTGFTGSHLAFQLFSLLPALICLHLLSSSLKLIRVQVEIRCLAILLLGFSFTFWRHAEIIEVYSLNLALTSLVVFWFIKWHNHREKKLLFRAAFTLGLAMLIHVQQLLYIPFLLYWGYLAFSFKAKFWIRFLLSFIVPASVLVIIPAVLQTNTLPSILFDNSFQDEVLSLNFKTIFSGVLNSLGLLFFNFGPLAILLIVGAFIPKTQATLHRGLFVLGIVVYGFAARYNVSDNYVFFLPAYYVLLILFSLYANHFILPKRSRLLLTYGMAIGLPIFYLIAPKIINKTSYGHEMNENKYYKGGARYFFYPGMRNNSGGLFLGKELKKEEISKDFNLEVEQNADKALLYLEFWERAHD